MSTPRAVWSTIAVLLAACASAADRYGPPEHASGEGGAESGFAGVAPALPPDSWFGRGGAGQAGARPEGGGGVGGLGGWGGGATALCVPGSVAACYTGPTGTEGVGLCKHGVRTCNDDGMGFGACEGEVLPTMELCRNLWDDDCDGLVNDKGPDCDCRPGATQACYHGRPDTLGVGACRFGGQRCEVDGVGWGECVGDVLPRAEQCAPTPVDIDCDGVTNAVDSDCQ